MEPTMLVIAALLLSTLLADATPAPAPAAAQPAAPIPPEAAKIRAQATADFKAKKYATACPLFEKASALAPASGEIFSDLGLCWDRAGDKTKAQAAELKAAALGDAKTRLHAYYNLWKAGRALDRQTAAKNDKGETVPGCITWNSDVACTQTLTACPYNEESRGTTFGTIYQGIAICDTKDRAQTYNQYGDTPTAGCYSMADHIIQETFCRTQDVCADNIDGSKDDLPACKTAVADCLKTRNRPKQSDCAVVFVDACKNHVGVVCDHVAYELSATTNFAADDQPDAATK